MVSGLLSRSFTDEQAAVESLRVFLVDTIGWEVAQDVTDSPTDRDIVLQSEGEASVTNNNTRYIRLRGTSNGIYLYTYETFTSVSVNTGEVYDATYGLLNIDVDSQGFFLLAVADLERVVLHSETYDGVRRVAYVGRITSYYPDANHPYPNLVKGGQSEAYGFYYAAAERNSWMIAADDAQEHYYCITAAGGNTLTAGRSSDRDGTMFISAPFLVCDGSTDNAELAGEPRGIYQVASAVSKHTSFIPLAGAVYIVLESNGVSMAVGPVTASGTTPPPL